MREIVENTGGRDFRQNDITPQNDIVELLEARLRELNVGNHIIGDGVVINDVNNSVTSGFVYYNGKIRIFDAIEASGTPLENPLLTLLDTRQVLTEHFDGVEKIIENRFVIRLPRIDETGTINLRTIVREKIAIGQNLFSYYSENFNSGGAALPSAGQLALGRNGNVIIDADGAILANTGSGNNVSTFDALNIGGADSGNTEGIRAKGNIESDAALLGRTLAIRTSRFTCDENGNIANSGTSTSNGDITSTTGDITATAGDITATAGDIRASSGHFIGNNAAKLLLRVPATGTSFDENLGSKNTNLTVSRPSTGEYRIQDTDSSFKIGAVLLVQPLVASAGSGRVATAIVTSSSTIDITIVDAADTVVNSSFSLIAFY